MCCQDDLRTLREVVYDNAALERERRSLQMALDIASRSAFCYPDCSMRREWVTLRNSLYLALCPGGAVSESRPVTSSPPGDGESDRSRTAAGYLQEEDLPVGRDRPQEEIHMRPTETNVLPSERDHSHMQRDTPHVNADDPSVHTFSSMQRQVKGANNSRTDVLCSQQAGEGCIQPIDCSFSDSSIQLNGRDYELVDGQKNRVKTFCVIPRTEGATVQGLCLLAENKCSWAEPDDYLSQMQRELSNTQNSVGTRLLREERVFVPKENECRGTNRDCSVVISRFSCEDQHGVQTTVSSRGTDHNDHQQSNSAHQRTHGQRDRNVSHVEHCNVLPYADSESDPEEDNLRSFRHEEKSCAIVSNSSYVNAMECLGADIQLQFPGNVVTNAKNDKSFEDNKTQPEIDSHNINGNCSKAETHYTWTGIECFRAGIEYRRGETVGKQVRVNSPRIQQCRGGAEGGNTLLKTKREWTEEECSRTEIEDLVTGRECQRTHAISSLPDNDFTLTDNTFDQLSSPVTATVDDCSRLYGSVGNHTEKDDCVYVNDEDTIECLVALHHGDTHRPTVSPSPCQPKFAGLDDMCRLRTNNEYACLEWNDGVTSADTWFPPGSVPLVAHGACDRTVEVAGSHDGQSGTSTEICDWLQLDRLGCFRSSALIPAVAARADMSKAPAKPPRTKPNKTVGEKPRKRQRRSRKKPRYMDVFHPYAKNASGSESTLPPDAAVEDKIAPFPSQLRRDDAGVSSVLPTCGRSPHGCARQFKLRIRLFSGRSRGAEARKRKQEIREDVVNQNSDSD